MRPTCGRRLAHVDCERIREVVGLANRCRAAAAIDLVLRKTDKLSDNVCLSAVEATGIGVSADEASGNETGPPQVRWVVAMDNDVLLALTRADSTLLFRPGDREPLVTVGAEEIAGHAEKYADEGW